MSPETECKSRTLQPEDLYRYKWVSDPRICPDGRRLAYVKSEVKDDREGYDSNIWMADMEGGEPQQFTFGGSDSHPRFSPDGSRLAFLSRRGDSQQIWLMPTDGGEARRLTSFEGSINGFRWSPDGERIAFSAVVTKRWLKDEGCEDDEDDDDDVRIITRMRYKMNGAGFTYDKFSHLFVIDKEGDDGPTQITDGEFDHRGMSWSPDSQYLATCARRCEDPDYAEHMDVYLFPADGSAVGGDTGAVKVTSSDRMCMRPVIGPRGSYVLHVGHDNEFYGATIPTIACTNIGDGTTQDLLEDFPTGVGSAVGGDCRLGSRPGEPVWDLQAEEIYFSATAAGRANLYALDMNSREVRAITDGDWVVLGFTFNHKTSQFALLVETAAGPADIWICDRHGQMRQITDANPWLQEIEMTSPERFEFAGAEGVTIEGWLLPGAASERGSVSPLIMQIHGGPHSAYGYGYYHEFHMLAAMGYGILYINPHGSRGYGQKFNAATHHDWGGKDYRDLMLGLDYALEKWEFDEQRLGVAGGSFGGYMVNWIVGHTDRFSAAVTMRSTCNRYSMFGTSDIGFNHGKWEFPGHPWDNPMGYLDRSPISYVANVDTPVLIIHSENDLRCPISQAEEFYTALKRLKKEVVFARFPDENHELSRSGKPTRRLRRLELIADWFDKYA